MVRHRHKKTTGTQRGETDRLRSGSSYHMSTRRSRTNIDIDSLNGGSSTNDNDNNTPTDSSTNGDTSFVHVPMLSPRREYNTRERTHTNTRDEEPHFFQRLQRISRRRRGAVGVSTRSTRSNGSQVAGTPPTSSASPTRPTRPLVPPGTEEDDEEDPCSICLDKRSNEAAILYCMHRYCFQCIKRWAEGSNNTCPLCKMLFSEIAYNIRSDTDYDVYKIKPRRPTFPNRNLIFSSITPEIDYRSSTNSLGLSIQSQGRPEHSYIQIQMARQLAMMEMRNMRGESMSTPRIMLYQNDRRTDVPRNTLYAVHPHPTAADFNANEFLINRLVPFIYRELCVVFGLSASQREGIISDIRSAVRQHNVMLESFGNQIRNIFTDRLGNRMTSVPPHYVDIFIDELRSFILANQEVEEFDRIPIVSPPSNIRRRRYPAPSPFGYHPESDISSELRRRTNLVREGRVHGRQATLLRRWYRDVNNQASPDHQGVPEDLTVSSGIRALVNLGRSDSFHRDFAVISSEEQPSQLLNHSPNFASSTTNGTSRPVVEVNPTRHVVEPPPGESSADNITWSNLAHENLRERMRLMDSNDDSLFPFLFPGTTITSRQADLISRATSSIRQGNTYLNPAQPSEPAPPRSQVVDNWMLPDSLNNHSPVVSSSGNDHFGSMTFNPTFRRSGPLFNMSDDSSPRTHAWHPATPGGSQVTPSSTRSPSRELKNFPLSSLLSTTRTHEHLPSMALPSLSEPPNFIGDNSSSSSSNNNNPQASEPVADTSLPELLPNPPIVEENNDSSSRPLWACSPPSLSPIYSFSISTSSSNQTSSSNSRNDTQRSVEPSTSQDRLTSPTNNQEAGATSSQYSSLLELPQKVEVAPIPQNEQDIEDQPRPSTSAAAPEITPVIEISSDDNADSSSNRNIPPNKKARRRKSKPHRANRVSHDDDCVIVEQPFHISSSSENETEPRPSSSTAPDPNRDQTSAEERNPWRPWQAHLLDSNGPSISQLIAYKKQRASSASESSDDISPSRHRVSASSSSSSDDDSTDSGSTAGRETNLECGSSVYIHSHKGRMDLRRQKRRLRRHRRRYMHRRRYVKPFIPSAVVVPAHSSLAVQPPNEPTTSVDRSHKTEEVSSTNSTKPNQSPSTVATVEQMLNIPDVPAVPAAPERSPEVLSFQEVSQLLGETEQAFQAPSNSLGGEEAVEEPVTRTAPKTSFAFPGELEDLSERTEKPVAIVVASKRDVTEKEPMGATATSSTLEVARCRETGEVDTSDSPVEKGIRNYRRYYRPRLWKKESPPTTKVEETFINITDDEMDNVELVEVRKSPRNRVPTPSSLENVSTTTTDTSFNEHQLKRERRQQNLNLKSLSPILLSKSSSISDSSLSKIMSNPEFRSKCLKREFPRWRERPQENVQFVDLASSDNETPSVVAKKPKKMNSTEPMKRKMKAGFDDKLISPVVDLLDDEGSTSATLRTTDGASAAGNTRKGEDEVDEEESMERLNLRDFEYVYPRTLDEFYRSVRGEAVSSEINREQPKSHLAKRSSSHSDAISKEKDSIVEIVKKKMRLSTEERPVSKVSVGQSETDRLSLIVEQMDIEVHDQRSKDKPTNTDDIEEMEVDYLSDIENRREAARLAARSPFEVESMEIEMTLADEAQPSDKVVNPQASEKPQPSTSGVQAIESEAMFKGRKNDVNTSSVSQTLVSNCLKGDEKLLIRPRPNIVRQSFNQCRRRRWKSAEDVMATGEVSLVKDACVGTVKRKADQVDTDEPACQRCKCQETVVETSTQCTQTDQPLTTTLLSGDSVSSTSVALSPLKSDVQPVIQTPVSTTSDLCTATKRPSEVNETNSSQQVTNTCTDSEEVVVRSVVDPVGVGATSSLTDLNVSS